MWFFKKKKKEFRTATEFMIHLRDEEQQVIQKYLNQTLLGSFVDMEIVHMRTSAQAMVKAVIIEVRYPDIIQESISHLAKNSAKIGEISGEWLKILGEDKT